MLYRDYNQTIKNQYGTDALLWNSGILGKIGSWITPQTEKHTDHFGRTTNQGNLLLQEQLREGQYMFLPTNMRMGESEVQSIVDRAISTYDPSATTRRYSHFEDGQNIYTNYQTSFLDHLRNVSGGSVTLQQGDFITEYRATQDLVSAEQAQAANAKAQQEAQAKAKAEQESQAKAAAEAQAQAKAQQEAQAAQQQREAEAARKAADQQLRYTEQFKASHESGNLVSGGDKPTVITGTPATSSTTADLNIGRGGNKRRGKTLSSILGI